MIASARILIRTASYLVAGTLVTPAAAQVPDTARSIARLDAALLAARAEIREEVWPEYDVARVGLLYMLPSTGKLLARWPNEVTGAQRVDATRTWTAAPVSWGRSDAVQVVPVQATSNRAQVLGLALHEGFHVHQQHFAQGSVALVENAMLTPEYPLFDIENEAGVAAEAGLLRAAVEAGTDAEARRLAAQFVALRRQRHDRLPGEFADFERLGEVHEGLAQYVLLRGLDLLAERDPSLRAEVTAEHVIEREVLSGMLERSDLSVRRRVYATGSQLGMLLDRLGHEQWKRRLSTERVWLHDLLAEMVGDVPVDSAALRRSVIAQLPAAAAAVARLRADRTRRRGELLGADGTLIHVSPAALPGARFDWCNFDPQNLLPDGDGNVLHTRMVSFCAGGKPVAAFQRPVVENRLTGAVLVRAPAPTLRAAGTELPLPTAGSVRVVRDLELTAEGVTIEAVEAVVSATSQGVFILPLR